MYSILCNGAVNSPWNYVFVLPGSFAVNPLRSHLWRNVKNTSYNYGCFFHNVVGNLAYMTPNGIMISEWMEIMWKETVQHKLNYIMGTPKRVWGLQPGSPQTLPQKLKFKKHTFCRCYDIKCFTWFALQPKSEFWKNKFKKQKDRALWLSHGTYSYICMYINAVANSVTTWFLLHNFLNQTNYI
jgi:hypothetical protein